MNVDLPLKKKLRVIINQRRYSDNNLWKFAGYMYDILWTCKKNLLSGKSTGVLLDKHQAVFFYIPKVASTSLLDAFSTINYGINLHITEVPKLNINDIKSYNDYFKFAFVRNPYDRLVSCYCDKVLRGGMKFCDQKPSFKTFVQKVCSISDKHSNIHFISQYTFLMDKNGRLLPNYIGKFENLNEDYFEICKKIGIEHPPKLKQTNVSRASRKYRTYYDQETKRLVESRYKEDLRRFGYDF